MLQPLLAHLAQQMAAHAHNTTQPTGRMGGQVQGGRASLRKAETEDTVLYPAGEPMA